MDGALTVLMSETDPELARMAMVSNLKLLEGMLELQPTDREMLITAVQGFAGYALMFLEDEHSDRAKVIYKRAVQYGLRALALRDERFSDNNINYREFKSLINKLKRKDIPAAYWTASAWFGYINLERSSPEALAGIPRAKDLMQWVMERESHFYYSAPLWFFGTYYSSMPPMLGGNSEKAKDFFEQALKEDGNRFLLGKVYYAQYYAVQTLNRSLFKEVLEEVINGSTDEPKELILLNIIAQRKALKLLERIGDFF